MIPAKLRDEIERWISEGKYGNLQINFVAGKIVNVNRFESIKIEILTTLSGTSSFNGTGPSTPGQVTNGTL